MADGCRAAVDSIAVGLEGPRAHFAYHQVVTPPAVVDRDAAFATADPGEGLDDREHRAGRIERAGRQRLRHLALALGILFRLDPDVERAVLQIGDVLAPLLAPFLRGAAVVRGPEPVLVRDAVGTRLQLVGIQQLDQPFGARGEPDAVGIVPAVETRIEAERVQSAFPEVIGQGNPRRRLRGSRGERKGGRGENAEKEISCVRAHPVQLTSRSGLASPAGTPRDRGKRVCQTGV